MYVNLLFRCFTQKSHFTTEQPHRLNATEPTIVTASVSSTSEPAATTWYELNKSEPIKLRPNNNNNVSEKRRGNLFVHNTSDCSSGSNSQRSTHAEEANRANAIHNAYEYERLNVQICECVCMLRYCVDSMDSDGSLRLNRT